MQHLKQKHRKQTGFTLIELLIVISIIGALAIIIMPRMKGSTSVIVAQQLDDFASSAVNNFNIANMKCGTSTDVASSTIVTTPSATNSLSLVINGTGFAAAYTGCGDEAALVPLRGKATGNSADTGGYKVAGYSVSWTGGGGNISKSVIFVGVPVEIVLHLYKKYSAVAGAQIATSLPGAGDATDPLIRYTAPGTTGITTLTLLKS